MSKFYYNDCGSNALTEEIISRIDNAMTYIKTGNFLFQDPTVKNALLDALERGVAVFILSNISDPDSRKSAQEEGHVDTHQVNLKELRNEGAHCRGLDDLHAKFLICDGKDGLLMSANYSPNSVGRNIETGICLEIAETRSLEMAFDILYMNSDVQSLSGKSGRSQILRQKSMIDSNAFDDIQKDSNIRLTVASSRETNLQSCNVSSIYDTILDIVRNARKYVDIVTWHFNALNKLPKFKDAVKSAVERGVRIRLYSNISQQHPCRQKSLDCIAELEQLGCQSFGDDNNHSKCVISESEGIIFTANIDGYHGLHNGFEVGCVLKDEALDEMRTFVDHLFE